MSPRTVILSLINGVVFLTALVPRATADVIAYAETSGDGAFGIEDLTTGAFTQLGTNGGLFGLGELGGTLYGLRGNTLYKVNPANGALTLVGTGATTLGNFGSTTTGLFGLGYDNNLYSINPTTGASTLKGPVGIFTGFHGGLSVGSDTLYFTEEPNPSTGPADLYSLNTTTGAATLIGSNSTSAVFGPVFTDGQLYAGSCGPTGGCGFAPSAESIYTLDTTNGAATFVSTVSGTTHIFDGMAPVLTATPEPSYMVLLAIMSLAGVIVHRTRRRCPEDLASPDRLA